MEDEGRAKRNELISGRERMGAQTQWGGGGVSTESRGQARARSTVRLSNTLVKGKNKTLLFEEEKKREDKVETQWAGIQTPGCSTNLLLWFCDSLFASLAG